MRRLCCALFAVVMVAPPAVAHGDLVASTPEAGDRLREVPTEVTLQLAEPPTPDSRFAVTDGCGDDVVVDDERDGTDIRLSLAAGQPGRWRVDYRVVSATDGHLVRGDFAFRVRGQRDCSEPSETSEPEPDPDETNGGVAAPPEGDADDGGGTSPVVPIVAIGGGIVLVAFVIRKMMAA